MSQSADLLAPAARDPIVDAPRTFEFGSRYTHYALAVLLGVGTFNIIDRTVVNLLLVPIGGHYVMDPKDAAYAIKELIKPKMAWPMHYASNPFLKGTPAEFKAALGQGSVQVIDAEPGTKKEF